MIHHSMAKCTSEATRLHAELAGGLVWDIHYHDARGARLTRVTAHCRYCARSRFERQNTDCRVSMVMPANAKK